MARRCDLTTTDSEDIANNVEQFTIRCTGLIAQQQVCIAQACYRLGLHLLSSKWMLVATANLQELGFSDIKKEAKTILHIILEVKRDWELEGKGPRPLDRMLLYENGLLVFTAGCSEMPRLLVHFALAALQRGLTISAREMVQRVEKEIYDAPVPPSYSNELLHAIDAQIIMQVEDGNMDGAVQEMHRRMDIVCRWIGNNSFELANDLYRLGCLFSLVGQHSKCVCHLEESLHVGAVYDDYVMVDSIILLATTYDALGDADNAIHRYKCALCMEEDSTTLARLMNALAHLLVRIGGQNQLAIEYLEKSLNIQQDVASSDNVDDNLLLDTMIIYGNVMASNSSLSQAIDWYDSALTSNPDRNVSHPHNQRAWYNKGVALLRKGESDQAAHAFKIIRDGTDKNSISNPSETASVLDAIGYMYLTINDFASAIECFDQSLSLCQSQKPRQKSGTLCNAASAHYRLGHCKESENYLNKALVIAESLGEESSDLKAIVMCKLAYILYRRKEYLRAHSLFSDAALIGEEGIDNEFSIKCEGYAIHCYLQLEDQHCKLTATTIAVDSSFDGTNVHKRTAFAQKSQEDNDHPGIVATENIIRTKKQEMIAQKPKFERTLIPVTDEHNATRYSGAICPWNAKLLSALGTKFSNSDSMEFSSKNRMIVCRRAFDFLLKQTEDCQAKYALEFEGLLDKGLYSKFMALAGSLNNAINTSGSSLGQFWVPPCKNMENRLKGAIN